MFLKQNQKDEIISKIKPLIESIADERVQRIMNEVQKQQIKAYEEFFEGQGKRFDAMLLKEVKEGEMREVIKDIVKEVLNESNKKVNK